MTSLLIAPQPITRDNLKTVIDEGWFSKEEVCQDIPAGTTPACP
jgi:D-xylose transport system substrate-binding protein